MKKSDFPKSGLLPALCLLFAATFLAGCDVEIGGFARDKYERTEELSSPMPPNGILIVETNVGDITISGGDGDQCSVVVTIIGRAGSAEQAQKLAEETKIKLEAFGDKLTVKVDKPAKKKNHSVEVSFNITLPTRANIHAESNVGDINVSAVTGKITATTNVGSVSCREVAGPVNLRTNVGNVSAQFSTAAGPAVNARAESNVGDVNFTAPAELSAKIDASTEVGSIRTDLPITITGKIGKKVHGTIGAGEGKLNFRTNVGSITIR